MSKFSGDFIQYNKKKEKDESKHLTLYLLWHSLLYIFLLFFAIFFIWYTVFISTHKFYAVSGPSMMSTLNAKITQEQILNDPKVQNISFDAVYVDCVSKTKIFDIIVIKKNDSSEDSLIKRKLAEAGDWITISKGNTVAGQACFNFHRIPKNANLDEISDAETIVDEQSGVNGYAIRSSTEWFERRACTEEKKAEGFEQGFSYCENFYFTYLEDYFNAVETDLNYFVSKEGLVYVQVPSGKFFYMGDNRAHSTDSRELGFCDVNKIIGRAEFIVYDFNLGNRILEVIKFYFRETEKFFAR